MKRAARRAAIGLRAHSGWAAFVVVAEDGRSSPVVVGRSRIEMVDPKSPQCVQPYHAAEGLPLPRAEALVEGCTAVARRFALSSFENAVGALKDAGHTLVGCGLLLSAARPASSLAAILASHALIHAAEGDLFRDALARAAEACRLPLTRVREKELLAEAGRALRLGEEALRARLNAMGKEIGPPWRQDEKLAALVAWLCLSRDAA
jgi:hypothetical protein